MLYRIAHLPELKTCTVDALIKNLPKVLERPVRISARNIPFTSEEQYNLRKINTKKRRGELSVVMHNA